MRSFELVLFSRRYAMAGSVVDGSMFTMWVGIASVPGHSQNGVRTLTLSPASGQTIAIWTYGVF